MERTFQESAWNSPKVMDKPITKIINCQLDIKLEQFMLEELNVVLTKMKSRKTAGLNEIPPKVWNLMTSFFNYAALSMDKRLHFPLP